jgi:hypothetical protein
MEKIDQNLQDEWNKKLAAEGLLEDPQKEDGLARPSADMSEIELKMLSEAMTGVLEEFSDLSPKIQEDIIADVLIQHKEGKPFSEVASRVKMLVQEGKKLEAMDGSQSDKHYIPQPSFEDVKLNGETEKLLEELRRKQKEREKKEQQKNTQNKPEESPDESPKQPPKEWIH